MPHTADPSGTLSPAEQDLAFRPSAVRPVEWSAVAEALEQAGQPARLRGGEPLRAVTGAALDSRVVRAGDLYVALPGARAHGASFAYAAVDAGAAGVLTDAGGVRILAELGLGDVPVLEVESVRAAAGVAAARVYGGEGDAGPALLGVTGTNARGSSARSSPAPASGRCPPR